MNATLEQPITDFYRYPPLGGDDWSYAFETAQARTLETQMLARSTLLDMANASDFKQAADYLRSTEYAIPAGAGLSGLEKVLSASRTTLRRQFEGWMHNEMILSLFKSRDDFANLRLAVRRILTKKPIGSDYSPDGGFPPEQFVDAFENEKYEMLPDYMADAAQRAILAWYSAKGETSSGGVQDKDIRRIDYAIDAAQTEFNLTTAAKLKNEFLLGLFRIQTDLTNIRTTLRLKMSGDTKTDSFDNAIEMVFLPGGYVEREKLVRGIEAGAEGISALFFATPYFECVQTGAAYAASEKSFLKIEQQCEEYLAGYLRSTISVAAGPQPVIAFLLLKENEIRTVRLLLTAKKNHLNPKLILDRIS
ncbi:MAG: V-type ATPase subunit [Sedimentisphaerales bacterium]|nr:V-type ATPase subunit [Sedimentisphaerales bacterium]